MVKIYWRDQYKFILAYIGISFIMLWQNFVFYTVINTKINNFTETDLIPIGMQLFSYGIISGTLVITSFTLLIYFCIRPFIKHYMQRIIMLGMDVTQYLQYHIFFLVAIMLVDIILLLVFKMSFSVQESDVGSSYMNIIIELLGNIAWPLWLVSIPLLIYNDKILPQTAYKKRKILITLSCIALYVNVNLFHIIPEIKMYMQEILKYSVSDTVHLQIDEISESSMYPSRILVHLVGIGLFIFAYNIFQKRYEIKC